MRKPVRARPSGSQRPRGWETGSPPPIPDSSLTRKGAPVAIEIEPEAHVFFSALSGLRDRDGHKAKRALTCLRAFRTRTLIEREPERRPEGEDGNRRHHKKHATQPAGARSFVASTLRATRLRWLGHGK